MNTLYTTGERVYDKLAPLPRDMSSFWLQQGNQWLNAMNVFWLTCAQHASDKLEKIISDYLCLLPKLRMPELYLLAKTHKSKEVIAGSWASRPIAAYRS